MATGDEILLASFRYKGEDLLINGSIDNLARIEDALHLPLDTLLKASGEETSKSGNGAVMRFRRAEIPFPDPLNPNQSLSTLPSGRLVVYDNFKGVEFYAALSRGALTLRIELDNRLSDFMERNYWA